MDLIANAYGWTDDQILDLTLPRLRLAVAAISKRSNADREFQIRLAEMVTQFLAAGFGVMVDKKGASKFEKWLKSIKFMNDPEPKDKKGYFQGRKIPDATKLMRSLGGRR